MRERPRTLLARLREARCDLHTVPLCDFDDGARVYSGAVPLQHDFSDTARRLPMRHCRRLFPRHVWRVVKDNGGPGPGVQGNHWVTRQCALCGKEKMKIIGTTLTGPK